MFRFSRAGSTLGTFARAEAVHALGGSHRSFADRRAAHGSLRFVSATMKRNGSKKQEPPAGWRRSPSRRRGAHQPGEVSARVIERRGAVAVADRAAIEAAVAVAVGRLVPARR